MAKRNMRKASTGFSTKIAPNRRSFLFGGVGLLAAGTVPFVGGSSRPWSEHPEYRATDDPLVVDVQKRTLRYFWETTNPLTGLAVDRYPSPAPASIAAVGFALTSYPIGVERGHITRRQAVERVATTLRFFEAAPQGPSNKGNSGYRGFFYHYLDPVTGERAEESELSTIDTALLLGGILFCQAYFDRDDADEAEIRRLAETIYRRVDWQWAQPRAPAIVHGWTPEQGFLQFDWRGYNEAMIIYLLALGSPSFPVDASAWGAWTSTYDQCWRHAFGLPHLSFGPLFGHQYCQSWVDFRGLQDGYLRSRGIDYFENNRRAVYAQRAYAVANPHGWKDYGIDVWGVTASDGPANVICDYDGKPRAFRAYAARGAAGPSDYDDGTLAPTALVASIAFAPEIVIPAMHEVTRRFGAHVYSTYGYLDAFNPSFNFKVPLEHGHCIPGFGWVASDYIGIDQGPIVAMIENFRSGLVWRVMRRSEHLRRGLDRAGFTGGWLGRTT
jgi:hypothetical protein